MKYDTSLRPYTSKRLEEIEQADILVGIPCYNNERTLSHVIQMVSHGLNQYYKDLRAVIMISDGGSTDDTRDVAKDFQLKPWQEKAKKVRKSIEDSLKELGISHPNFQTKILNELAVDNNFITAKGKSFKCSAKGIDKVEFFISTNQGEDPKPLAKVASGGEISRIMLSLKSTLAKNDKLPLLIFDEIDVGVSGRIAQKVGNVLKDLAKYHQIIAITHLPQIAGLADHHYEVKKTDDKSRTSSSIEKLTDEGRVREVAKLMSGEKVTKASIKGAQELTGINFNSE